MNTGLLAVAVLMLAVFVLLVWLISVWHPKDLQTAPNVGQVVSVFLGVPSTLLLLVQCWTWLWRRRGSTPVITTETVTKAQNALAGKIAIQWTEEARVRGLDNRFPMPVRWELITDQRIMDHPEHITSSKTLAWSGTADDIGAMVGRFRALRRRRLVIIGGPGAGKTTLAVQLVRELLDEPDPGEPVPVLLSIADWDTERFPRLQSWLAARLTETYPLLRAAQYAPDVADQLVRRARILPVLDGLDEIPSQARASVIAALNESLADNDQLILTSRTTEYAEAIAAAGDVITSAAVLRPLPLSPAVAADYLTHCLTPSPGPAWEQTLTALRATPAAEPASLDQVPPGPAGVLARVTATPLGLWLLRTVYIVPGTDPAPLTDQGRFPTPTALQAHLFDQLIPALIKARSPSDDSAEPFRPRHHLDPAQTRRWLGYLAHHLTNSRHHDGSRHTRDYAWWRLAASTDAINPLNQLTIAQLISLAVGLPVGFAAGVMGGLKGGLAVGLVAGPVAGLAVGSVVGGAIAFTATSWARESPGYADLSLRHRSAELMRQLARAPRRAGGRAGRRAGGRAAPGRARARVRGDARERAVVVGGTTNPEPARYNPDEELARRSNPEPVPH
ncbi:NACHT domain-containing protein [Spirillospora sp. NPDC049652]